MKIEGSKLKHLPVVTMSGEKLGKVLDFEVDPESHEITTYLVGPSRLVRPIQRIALRIHRSQVCSISLQRMVVEDGSGVDRTTVRPRPRLPKGVMPAISTRGVATR